MQIRIVCETIGFVLKLAVDFCFQFDTMATETQGMCFNLGGLMTFLLSLRKGFINRQKSKPERVGLMIELDATQG